MTDINNLFFELIRVAISNQVCLSHTPSADEWGELYAMAKKQSLVGICFAGVQSLQMQQQTPPEQLYLQWMGLAAKIQQQSENHRRVLSLVGEVLKNSGIRSMLMKGLVCASRYPEPLLRQCGDIDFVVREEDYVRTLDALKDVADVDRTLVHEHHGMAYIDGVQLEPHYKIHNYQNPWNDITMRMLQAELFASDEHVSIKIGDAEVEKMLLEFEGMFLVSHMINHIYAEGLGMRQIMDFAFWIASLHVRGEGVLRSGGCSCEQARREVRDFDMELYHAYLDKMHMRRAAKIFTIISERLLGIDTRIFDYQYSNKELSFADKLAEDIMKVGNFARGAEDSPQAGISAYIWTIKRVISLGYLCPSEAYWWPVSKFFRYFWRKVEKRKNNYRI